MAPTLSAAGRRALRLQRAVSLLLAPLWIPVFTALMWGALRWRIADAAPLRRAYARLRAESRAPLLVCANHLTMLDSFVIGWALGGIGFYLRDFAALPWNTPERVHFADTWWKRALVYLLKCVPISRGSARGEVALVFEKLRFLMLRGDVALVFPEGGRSRSSRVEEANAAYGVGRLVNSLPGCRVLCVYLRGAGQHTWTDWPARGERFRATAQCFEPQSEARGLRASLDVSRQIVRRLAEMERAHFAAHGAPPQPAPAAEAASASGAAAAPARAAAAGVAAGGGDDR